MIGRRELPPAYSEWNRRWGAPFGRRTGQRLARVSPRLVHRFPRLLGPFGFQAANTNREWEYPWAYHAAPVLAGQVAVDLGGGLGGFQFVLAKAGVAVVNVDPGERSRGVGWAIPRRDHERLNAALGTNVELRSCHFEDAGIESGSVDTVYAISTLEHVPGADLAPLLAAVESALRPGGRFVATVDLFLDLAPFSPALENRFGINVDLHALIGSTGLSLVEGRPDELLGFPDFDQAVIMQRLAALRIAREYPALAQCFVLRRAGRGD